MAINFSDIPGVGGVTPQGAGTPPTGGGLDFSDIPGVSGFATSQTPAEISGVRSPIKDLGQAQQIIGGGVQQAAPRVVEGRNLELPENAGFFKRSVTGVGNFLFGSAPDILARQANKGFAEQTKSEIMKNAQSQIEIMERLLEAEDDPSKRERMTLRLANYIQETNDLLGDDVFQAPSALQVTGAVGTVAANLIPAFKGGQLIAGRKIGTKLGTDILGNTVERGAIRQPMSFIQKTGALGFEGGLFGASEAASRTGDLGETFRGGAIGAGIGAALPGVGRVAGKVTSPILRGLERPNEVENRFLRTVARALSPVSNIIKSAGETGAKYIQQLEDVRINRDLFRANARQNLQGFKTVYEALTPEEKDIFYDITASNTRANPALKGRPLLTTEELLAQTDNEKIRAAIQVAEPVTREISEAQVGRVFKGGTAVPISRQTGDVLPSVENMKEIPANFQPIGEEALKAQNDELLLKKIDDVVNKAEKNGVQTLSAEERRLYDSVNSIVVDDQTLVPSVKASKETAEAYQFYSPNIEENLNFDEASRRLSSENQARYRKIGQDIDEEIGLKTESFDAIGDWSDGAENTVFNIVKTPTDFDTIRYSAALKGKAGNQKAVIPFIVDKSGPDKVYLINIGKDKADVMGIRQSLDEAGIQFRTIVPKKEGHMVVVFDSGNQLGKNIKEFNKKHGTRAKRFTGRGEFLGADTRATATREYDRVIGDYRRSGRGGSVRVPDTVTAKGNRDRVIRNIFNTAKKGTLGEAEGGVYLKKPIQRTAETPGVFFPTSRTEELERGALPDVEERIKQILATNKEIQAIPDEALRLTKARNMAEAELDKYKGPRAGKAKELPPMTAQQAREAGIETDALKAYENFIERESDIAAQFQVFGTENLTGRADASMDEIVKAFREKTEGQIRKDLEKRFTEKESKAVAELITKNVDAFLGVQDFNELASNLKKFQALKLGLSFLPNLFQTINTAMATDLPTLAKGFTRAFKPFGKEFAEKAGAKEGAFITGEVGKVNKFMRGYLTPFRWTEQSINRAIAANTGATMAEALAKEANNVGTGRAVEALERLEQLVGKQFEKGKLIELTEKDLLRAANKFTKLTQFGYNPLDIPFWANSPAGSVFFQFKSFAYNQLKFVFNQTIGELQSGNPGRAARNFALLATVFPMSGAVLNSFRNFITGRETDHDLLSMAGYLDSMAAVGGMGIVYDVVRSSSSTPGRLLEFLGGPTIATGADVATTLIGEVAPELLSGEVDVPLEELFKLTTKQFGGLGGAARNVAENF